MAAIATVKALQGPLPLTSLGKFELTNAIRLAVFRRVLDPRKAKADLQALEADLANGVFTRTACDWAQVHAKAEQLSSLHTIAGGQRGMDILHVASALILGVSEFCTFDQRQAELAGKTGLRVKP